MSSYPVYAMPYANPGSPPPYTLNPSYNGPPQPFPTQPPAYVVTSQPFVAVQHQPVVKDHLYWSITNLLCCNLLFGIIAVVFSAKARSAIRLGHSTAASGYSRTAVALNTVGFILGVAAHVIWISWIIYWMVIYREKYSSNNHNSYNHFNG